MSYFIYHRLGASERDPPSTIFPLLLDELEEDLDDEEHTSVSVIHETEWTLGFYGAGHVTYENVEEDDGPRHMRGVSREKAIELMQALANGELEAIETEPWQPGY